MGYGRQIRVLELGRNQVWNESAMFHKMLIFQAGIDFVLGSSFPPSRESIPRRNLFSQGIDFVESMPGVINSLKILAQSTLADHVNTMFANKRE
jgi:hypothetical protein